MTPWCLSTWRCGDSYNDSRAKGRGSMRRSGVPMWWANRSTHSSVPGRKTRKRRSSRPSPPSTRSIPRSGDEDSAGYQCVLRNDAGSRRGRAPGAKRRASGDFLRGHRRIAIRIPARHAPTADRFGRIAAALGVKSKPIPSNDIWIAAHAMQTGAELLSFDAHFEAVDGLAWSVLPAEH